MKFKTAPIFLAFLVLGCLAPALAATEPALPAWAIGPFTRVQDGHPVISPNTNSTKDGTTFTEGLVFFKNQWFVYYGCADSFVGAAISPATVESSAKP